ncbi:MULTISPECIES: ERF family protein [Staphylococcus]|uniref:Putative phage single-strand DNA binding protein n=3 Tax=Staphylococcus TaxID=1279 RepID=A0A7Z7QQ61_STASC|nr:ERF family protein [Staphylococcus schleiferi]QGS45344.1 single-stranded DNA-binding protein [Mammaliicoccus fleurettii]NHA34017.1 single-stranded DNA-binding protein [Staphylococcus schleiferi]NHA38618.1 single-stranded DNA-binding protein [Staphylococcus schleiferi]NHA40781.1 single-stranded DNA-binding protein [Staphylococcus schleiferi]RTX77634.1 single-stranded DNA-binding protein [Staphylococcus schleiferi subsp. schleiferi]
MNKSESVVEINKAMVAFRKEVKQPLKDKNNPFFKSKYVPLENVVEAIDEAATPHGLSYTQWALNDSDGRVGVATMLMHESGEYIEYDPVFMNAEKNTPQGAGSLISYLKRYSLSAIFGITSDQDDDGNAASGKQSKLEPKASSKTIGALKQEVLNFVELMKSLNKDVTQQQAEQTFGIQNYTAMTEQQAVNTINRIQTMAKKYKENE